MAMMKLFIGNKAYSSWSLRGWLACKLSGLPFEEVVVPLYDEEWEKRREGDEFAPSSGKVPILWDGDDIVVWDSLAIVEYLNEKAGGDQFWPTRYEHRDPRWFQFDKVTGQRLQVNGGGNSLRVGQ